MIKNVIVCCEESQAVCLAFRERGHNAFSNDLLPCSGGYPEFHLQMDAKKALRLKSWDLLIAHPPCTRLTNSVWWYIIKHQLFDEVKDAADFFNFFLDYEINEISAENPIQNKLAQSLIRHYDQIIQPYNFGDNASKATCLWLKNLPPLISTGYYPPRIVNGKPRWGNQTDGGWNKLPPSEDRAKLRSKTYLGIAQAMADQWG